MDTIREHLNFGMLCLQDEAIETAKLDAEVLLAHCLECDRLELIVSKNKEVADDVSNVYKSYIARRKMHEPVAYIVECKEFWGLHFKVTANVLIPRPDSEALIELMLKVIPKKNYFGKVLDLGTGSGCLIAAALSELPNFLGIAIDESDAALEIAKHNIATLGFAKRCQVLKSNWFENIPDVKFDLIISNPPYIETNYDLLETVVGFEPHSALFAGNHGLDDYYKIAAKVKKHLHKDSFLLIEIGINQGLDVTNIFAQQGLVLIETAFDLEGRQRGLAFQMLS